MKYSIITPVYNRADCVARCLDSVIRNLKWGVEFEHIIVDDGSHDESPQICQEYAEKYPHIKYIAFPQNRGTNAARNAAIKTASGDFCIILDSDDYFVDDAINTFDKVVSKGGYCHYCFVADDMQEYYQSCELLKNKNTVILTYSNFLLNQVTGDFIHVIDTNILRKYPFEENLRVYEGVFFKRFYREAQTVLFTNKLVTIRERSREDSVSRLVNRGSKAALRRGLKAKQLILEWFEDDLNKTPEGRYIIGQTLLSLLDLNLVMSNYKAANLNILDLRRNALIVVPAKFRLIYNLRLGWLYYLIGIVYVYIQHSILKVKIG